MTWTWRFLIRVLVIQENRIRRCRDTRDIKKERGNMRKERRANVRKGRGIHRVTGQDSRASDVCSGQKDKSEKRDSMPEFLHSDYMVYIHHWSFE